MYRQGRSPCINKTEKRASTCVALAKQIPNVEAMCNREQQLGCQAARAQPPHVVAVQLGQLQCFAALLGMQPSKPQSAG